MAPRPPEHDRISGDSNGHHSGSRRGWSTRRVTSKAAGRRLRSLRRAIPLDEPHSYPGRSDDVAHHIGGSHPFCAWPRSKRKGAQKPKYRSDLAGDEGQKGAHTIDRHVERTDCELRARLRSDKQIGGGSSFLNEQAAQDLTDRAMIR
ncbi:RNase A-like domain-containing protein [Streptomyces sp. NBC_00063]|uniref:RNase A-like domain-containing protein n=1 Tax=Streptomyces sp. NBC_00063 TaxID=2975638 RepID=UPI00338F4CBF